MCISLLTDDVEHPSKELIWPFVYLGHPGEQGPSWDSMALSEFLARSSRHTLDLAVQGGIFLI